MQVPCVHDPNMIFFLDFEPHGLIIVEQYEVKLLTSPLLIVTQEKWLTTAIRILRYILYIARIPVWNINSIVKICDASVWAHVAWNLEKIKFGSWTKALTWNDWEDQDFKHKSQQILSTAIQHNVFFAHPENILISMVNDKRSVIRELGWRRFLIIRSETSKECDEIRFKVPKLNFKSLNYYNMIDWQRENITEPPLTKHLSDEKI